MGGILSNVGGEYARVSNNGDNIETMPRTRAVQAELNQTMKEDIESANILEFVYSEPEDPLNGFVLNNYYINEELMTTIISFVPPKDILKLGLVCKNWNRIIKSHHVWVEIYERKYKTKKPIVYPWYLYYVLLATNFFNTNLLKNCNGQQKLKHWTVKQNSGDGFAIEDQPVGSDSLPSDVEDFEGHTCCFVTSYGACMKEQMISLRSVHIHIMNLFKPKIYLSDWATGRFDCGSLYKLSCRLHIRNSSNTDGDNCREHRSEQFQNQGWTKKEITITKYSNDVDKIIFEHQGRDTSFWKGHYGSKMAGAVVKIILD